MAKLARWRIKILEAPMITGPITSKAADERRISCSKDRIPCAIFWRDSKRSKYGHYECDLTTIRDLYHVTDETLIEIKGVMGALLTRWHIDKKVGKSEGISYSASDRNIQIYECPTDEAQYVHFAVCHVLSLRLKEVKESNHE